MQLIFHSVRPNLHTLSYSITSNFVDYLGPPTTYPIISDVINGRSLVLSAQMLSLCIPSPWFCITQPFVLQKIRFSYILQYFLFGIGIWIWPVENWRSSHHTSVFRVSDHESRIIDTISLFCCRCNWFKIGAKIILKSHLNFYDSSYTVPIILIQPISWVDP